MADVSRDEKEKAIFHASRSMHDAAQRDIYLKAACGADHELRMRVDSLLSASADAGEFLELSPIDSQISVDHGVAAEAAGTMIGTYKLLQQIGEGGFGVVYMAEQQQPVIRKVALKIVKPGMDTKQVIARFEAEKQALAMMEHPNIAKVFDAGETDNGRPFFVMELVRGISIVDYCDQQKLTNQRRLQLFRNVCVAIQHAHQKGIIHRDLKPSNILVTLHDGQPSPR